MNINVHIERLVLDGVASAPADSPLLQTAVERELTSLLASGGLSDALQFGGTLYNVKTSNIQLASDGGSSQLGEQIAGAIYEGIGK